MKKAFSQLETFLNTSFAIACIIHVTFIGYYTIYPELPEIKIYSKDIKDVEFPLVFRICSHDLQDPKGKYKKIGYNGAIEFFRGLSMFDWKNYGWNGHADKKGSVIGSLEYILEKVSVDWNRTVEYLVVSDRNGSSTKGHKTNWNILPIYPSCQMIDFEDHFNLTKKA